MTDDACDKFVGPMPVDKFLEDFVPKAPENRPANGITFSHSSVSGNENEFICAVEASGLCPKLKFIDTVHRPDGTYHLKPDISIYSDGLSDELESQRFLDWKTVDLWVENKNNKHEIFCTFEQMKIEEERDEDSESHVEWTDSAYKTCGQLVAYASELCRSQFRIFSFAVVLFGDTGRLLRWDRGGVIYTESFQWTNEPDTLFEFFWRLNFLSDVDRGYDITVTSVSGDEAEDALEELQKYDGLEKIKSTDLRKFLVRDDRDTNEPIRYYIAPGTVWHTESLFGRSTFGYIAYDVARSKLVYLKDFWRTDREGIQKEGDVYRELHDAQVSNIPILGRAGDVPLSPDDTSTASSDAQKTRTHEYVKESGLGHEWCPGRPDVEPYVHYRLVLETLGRPLNTFKSTRQLCEVIRDAIVAHKEAYERTHILHRDVSAGNILITEEGSGILIDWDLSKKMIPDADGKPRRHSRTGTWQFISTARLLDPSTRPHEVSDDLESFFWVLLYLVVKCRNAANLKMDFSQAMQRVFDQHTDMDRDGVVKGGAGKLACLGRLEINPRTVKALVKTPCRDIIEGLRSLFQDLYIDVTPDPHPTIDTSDPVLETEIEQDPRAKDAYQKLCSSEWVLNLIDGHLASEWDIDDDGSLHKTVLRPDSSVSRDCRKRKAPDSKDDWETYNKIRRGRMPPPIPSKPSGDSYWSKARPHSHSETFVSAPSRGVP